jgi:hypothetical protein
MTKFWLELPPPGTGFVTVTATVAALASSVFGTVTISAVPDCDVTVTPVPLKVTVDVGRKLLPLIVSDIAAEPAVTLEGERLVTVGAGFGGGGAALATKETVLELTLPGLTIVTGTLPTVPGTVTLALNEPELMNVVTTALPLNMIVEPLRKFAPLTVNVRVVPT